MNDEKRPSSRPALPVLLLALLAAVGWLVLSPTDTETASPKKASAEAIEAELFGAPPACSASGQEGAARLAEAAERQAQARAERAPFHPASGPAAARTWAEAEACWRAAGDSNRAEMAQERGETLRQRILEEVRARRLRLRRAEEKKQPAEALAEIKALRELFEGAPGLPAASGPPGAPGVTDAAARPPSYAAWLSREERRLAKATQR